MPATLARLKAQELGIVPCEVLFIDNASTDVSAEVTLASWERSSVPLRVIREPKLGVRYARERGLAEAQYEFLGFIDDDNWVARDWVATAYQVLSTECSLGAVGSIRDPVCEVASPEWFHSFHSDYAILTQGDLEEIQDPPSYLPTAGLESTDSRRIPFSPPGSQREATLQRRGPGIDAGSSPERLEITR